MIDAPWYIAATAAAGFLIVATACTAQTPGSAAITGSAATARTPAAAPAARPGIDVLIADGFKPLAGKRVGLITNPTGVTADLRSTVDVLHAAPEVELVALFGPEHGVRGNVDAGGNIEDATDPATGLPAYSLYGKTRKPTPEMLAGLDALVYDIQDIGSRSYTYISTMAVAMEAAAENNVAFVVLDRPNPLNGNRIEGRPLDMKYKSFVGAFPIPYVYGMTCGELARMINAEGWLEGGKRCNLTVVPVQGWRRDMTFEQTHLHWVPTSPHIPRADTSLFYAATGIMGELHVVSEGVGYTLPFELAGAPFIDDAEAFARALNARGLTGVTFRPMYFTPYYIDRIKGENCGGVQIHFTDPGRASLTPIQFHIMDEVRQRYPDVKLFGNKRDAMFDKVCGTDRIRIMFEEGRPIEEILDYWNEGTAEFQQKRAKYLMYR
jgi:uncharacterized protein YbbC (DUF1343 family)